MSLVLLVTLLGRDLVDDQMARVSILVGHVEVGRGASARDQAPFPRVPGTSCPSPFGAEAGDAGPRPRESWATPLPGSTTRPAGFLLVLLAPHPWLPGGHAWSERVFWFH